VVKIGYVFKKLWLWMSSRGETVWWDRDEGIAGSYGRGVRPPKWPPEQDSNDRIF
jgi:hypothetical protein